MKDASMDEAHAAALADQVRARHDSGTCDAPRRGVPHPARLLAVTLAFVSLACAPSRDDRDRRAPPASERIARQPDHAVLAEPAPRARVAAPLASPGAHARRTARVREPVVSGLTIPRITPEAPGASSPFVSLPSMLAPPPAPISAPTVQGLPAAPQQYGHTTSNFGPTGPILGTSPGTSTPSSQGATSGSFGSSGR